MTRHLLREGEAEVNTMLCMKTSTLSPEKNQNQFPNTLHI